MNFLNVLQVINWGPQKLSCVAVTDSTTESVLGGLLGPNHTYGYAVPIIIALALVVYAIYIIGVLKHYNKEQDKDGHKQ